MAIDTTTIHSSLLTEGITATFMLNFFSAGISHLWLKLQFTKVQMIFRQDSNALVDDKNVIFPNNNKHVLQFLMSPRTYYSSQTQRTYRFQWGISNRIQTKKKQHFFFFFKDRTGVLHTNHVLSQFFGYYLKALGIFQKDNTISCKLKVIEFSSPDLGSNLIVILSFSVCGL